MAVETKEQAMDLVAAIFARAGARIEAEERHAVKSAASNVAGDVGQADPDIKAASGVDTTGSEPPDINEVGHAIAEANQNVLADEPPDINEVNESAVAA